MNKIQERLKYPKLRDFVGPYLLCGVDFENVKIDDDDVSGYYNAQMMRFKLDDKIYVATENPDDGYRSSLSEIMRSDDKMKNVFRGQPVKGRYKEDEHDDILEFISVKTGKVVLMVGTDNTDDYYPSFVASFSPENFE